MSILVLLKTLWDNKSSILIGLFVSLCISFYLYYSYSSNKIDSLLEKAKELSRIIEEKDFLIKNLKLDYDSIIASKDELLKTIDSTNKELDITRKKLFRQNSGKKSIDQLARKKTQLVENKINKATDDVIKCFEKISRNEGDC
ncbi:hypothetical protein UFOVP410_76 [uncultured Caudovirales phage]|uniref:Uncharacterized protein n=1 Tax=uncultured Caudovirales phage TaxID=2100421 RepID=A0A6J5M6V3_9CAUD|nr:hypothetical protein UFOVP410_76 [uncultured Caudovirales phage]